MARSLMWGKYTAGMMGLALFTSSAAAQGTTAPPKRAQAPAPMQMVTTPTGATPSSLTGKSLRVVFVVDSVGKVTNVVAIPTITDSVYAKRFSETMKAYHFKPAKDSTGKAVGGEFRVDITFGKQ